MIVTSIVLAAALQAAVAPQLRKDYVACLKEAEQRAASQKIDGDGFAAFAHQSCAAIEQPFKAELMKFGMKNGLSRQVADEDAQLQIDDYVYTAEMRYRDALAHPTPR